MKAYDKMRRATDIISHSSSERRSTPILSLHRCTLPRS